MEWVAWHDAYESHGMTRKPLGIVEARDYHQALFAAWKKFKSREWEPKGGRQNISVTPAWAELVCVRDLAKAAQG